MDKIGTSHAAEGADCTFSNTILMLCTGSTEVKVLILAVAVLSKLMGAEDTIIGMVFFDGYAAVLGIGFNVLLAKDGAGSCEISLRLMEDLGTGMVNKYCATDIAVMVTSMTISIDTATADGRYIMIH